MTEICPLYSSMVQHSRDTAIFYECANSNMYIRNFVEKKNFFNDLTSVILNFK